MVKGARGPQAENITIL
ncbi:hypothetical protein [Paraclostridium sordellii]|nr:hypothetical protein [Clostridioides difficile]